MCELIRIAKHFKKVNYPIIKIVEHFYFTWGLAKKDVSGSAKWFDVDPVVRE
jgi:hypothetical protein